MIAITFTFHQVSQYKNRILKINELREMEAKQDLDGWTDLKGEICHVHSASTHYGKSPNLPVRCRGMAFMFPGDDHATMVILFFY